METIHQTWGLDRTANRWRVDVFREPFDDDGWVARRDETIRLPYAELIEHTADGIPYERPEVVLLFKAKHSRAKDEADLAAVLPGSQPSGAHCSPTGSNGCTPGTSGSTTCAAKKGATPGPIHVCETPLRRPAHVSGPGSPSFGE